MREIFLLIFVFALVLDASILDFQTLDEAKKAYENGKYERSAKLYKKIDKDEAKFNAADALYKAGKFQEALRLFKSIFLKNLEFKKLHNIGNCYAKLKKFDDAIKMYEKALEIKEDKDTRFNLELLKRLKEKKQNQQNSKQNQNSKDEKSRQNSDKQNQKGQQKDSNKQKQSNQQKNQQNNKNHKAIKKDEPISDMEVRKWNKVLNQRGIHTLMLPLQTETKGAEDEKHPW